MVSGQRRQKEELSILELCEFSIPVSAELGFLLSVWFCRPIVYSVAHGMITLYILCMREFAVSRL